MITVINNFNESTEMYEGMSLADASAQFMLEANQLVNDFMMDLLMTEHQYLFDHGEQIDWTNEAADGGLGFMDKVGNLVDNAKNLFLKIVNNIIAFVQEKTSQVINWFRKIGLDKSKITKAFKNNQNEDLEVPKCITHYGDFITKIENEYTSAFANASTASTKDSNNEMITSAGEFLEKFDDWFDDVKVKSSEVAADNVINIIFKSDSIIKSAKKAYKKATDSLENAKKKFAGKKNMDGSDIKDELEKLRAGVLNNTYVMRDLVKVYGGLVREAITIAKEMVKVQKGKDKDDDKKEDKKDDEKKKNPLSDPKYNLPKASAPPTTPKNSKDFNADKESGRGMHTRGYNPTNKLHIKDAGDVDEWNDTLKDLQHNSAIDDDDDYNALIEACEYILGINDDEDDTLNEAADYVTGCINGDYEVDEELLEACAAYIIEAEEAKKKVPGYIQRAKNKYNASRLDPSKYNFGNDTIGNENHSTGLAALLSDKELDDEDLSNSSARRGARKIVRDRKKFDKWMSSGKEKDRAKAIKLAGKLGERINKD